MSASPSSSEPGVKFRVAICGAGIAGLILAITIAKYAPSIPIDLYEAHASIETEGVGISLRRQEVFAELGLLDEFKQILTPSSNTASGAIMRRSDIRDGGYFWNQKTRSYPAAAVQRQHLVAILERHLPASCKVHLRKRLLSYIEPEQGDMTLPIKLRFADGTKATTDVLIGADGIRSAVRKTMFETASLDQSFGDKTDLKQYVEAMFTGITIYRSLVPVETLRKTDPDNLALKDMVQYYGKGRSLIAYPVANGTMVNCATFVCDPSLTGTRHEGHWVADATGDHDELIRLFDNFESDTRSLIKSFEKPTKWALHVVRPLPFCVRKRVALIGDACHAMAPHMAAGAGQAVEDGFVLGRLIAHPLMSLSRIPDALRIYQEVRFPIAREVARISLASGLMYSFMDPEFYDGDRNGNSLDRYGVSANERQGMESITREKERRLDWLEGVGSALQQWEAAELKLRADKSKVSRYRSRL